jgi:hypothetical protein
MPHRYAPRLYNTPWEVGSRNATLGHRGGAAPANSGEPAALPAGEVVGLDHVLT